MKNTIKKIISALVISCLIFSLLTCAAFAKNDNNNGNGNDQTGTGQTQIHIHGVGEIGDNKDEVTVVIDGVAYTGTLEGGKLTIDMGTTDNGFDIAPDGSKEITYQNGDNSGTITVTHKEGNGNNINKEHDKGLNNFNGSVTPNTPPVEPPVNTETPVVPETPVIPYFPIFEFEEPVVELPEEEVPLADVPRTGDATLLWAALSFLSLAGAGALVPALHKKD